MLVVGGAGYVGSTSVERFVEAGHEVVVYDNLSSGHRAAVPRRRAAGGRRHRRRRRGRRACSPMASTRSSTARHAPWSASRWRTRALLPHQRRGGVSLLEAMREAGVTRLVYSSTAAVYGEPRRVPIAEADRTQPINPYGETKLAFEGAMRWFCAAHDFRAISLRYFNVAGATGAQRRGPRPRDAPHAARPARRRRRGDARPDLRPGLPTPDGTCIRDFIHVRDLAERAPPRARGDRRGRPVARGLQPRARPRASACARSSRPPAASPAAPSRPASSSAAAATRRCSSPRRDARAASSAGSRRTRRSSRCSPTPGRGARRTRTATPSRSWSRRPRRATPLRAERKRVAATAR